MMASETDPGPRVLDLEAQRKIRIGCHRLLLDLGYAAVDEVTLPIGRRVDLLAINPSGRLIIVEIKSSLADFRADSKWQEYLAYGDAFYFAVNEAFPLDVLPEDQGLIIADHYGGEVLRQPLSESGGKSALSAPRRASLTRKLAVIAARRLSDIQIQTLRND